MPGRVTQPVRTVDILPTVLDLLGTSPPAPIEGVSLVPLMSGATRALALDGYGEAMYPLHHYGWSELTTLRSDAVNTTSLPVPPTSLIE